MSKLASSDTKIPDSDNTTIADDAKLENGSARKGGDAENDTCQEVEADEPGQGGDGSPEKNGRTEVQLDAEDDPKQLPVFRKWLTVLTICTAAVCVTCTSSIVRLSSARRYSLMILII